MEFITVASIFLASLNMSNNDCDFAYNMEVADHAVTSLIVYKKSKDGKFLSKHLTYKFTYDEQDSLVKKEVQKWNSAYERWEHSHCLNYVYDMFGFSLEYALWDEESVDYNKIVAKQVYNNIMDGAVTITLYKWNKLDNEWMEQSNVLAMNLDNNLLSSFELAM